MSQKGIGSVCPRCGKEFNGDECEHCGYGSERDKQVYGYKDDDLNRIPFPQNNTSLGCYVVSAILIVLAIISYATLSPIASMIEVGIACIIAAIGKAVHTIHLSMEAIHDAIIHNRK